MESPSRESRLEAWRTWISANLAPFADRVDSGAEAAVAAGQRGLGRFGCAAVACREMGLGITPEIWAGLLRESEGLAEFVASTADIQPGKNLTAEGLAELGRILRARQEEYRALARRTTGLPRVQQHAVLPAPTPVSQAPTARAVERPMERPVAAPAGPAFSLQGFLSEHGILVISYVGAFLLIIATLLFEVYGTTGADGMTRFGAVLALTVFFAAAGWYGLRSTRLRLVGRSYVAVAALMAPLDFAAAYSFLVLNRYGITAAVAVTVAGGACAVLYGALAGRLRSVAYAHMGMVALAAGWAGLLTAAHADRWSGAGLAALALVYVGLAAKPGALKPAVSLWSPLLEWYVHAAVAAGGVWAVVSTAALDLRAAMLYLGAAALVATIAYLAHTLLSASRLSAALAGAAALAAWAATIVVLGVTDWAGAALAPSTLVAVAARRGYLGRRLSAAAAPSALFAVHVAAGCAVLWTAVTYLQVGPKGSAAFTATTFGVLAVAYLLEAVRTKDEVLAGSGLLAVGLAYAAVLYGADLADWRGAAFLPAVALYGLLASRPRFVGATGDSLAPAAELFTHVGALVAILMAANSSEGWQMTVVLGGLTAIYAVQSIQPRRRWLVWIPAIGVSATVLQGSRPMGLSPTMVALELTVLAWAYVLASRLAPNQEVRIAFMGGAAAQALAVALLPAAPDGAFAILLVAAAGVGVIVAILERQPAWLAAATPLFSLAWFHGAAALIPPPPSPGPDDLVRVFAPLPVVYSLVGLGLRRRFGRAWTLPPHVSAAAVASGVVFGALTSGDFYVLGWALLAYSVLTYMTAILEKSAIVAAVAGLMLAAAVPSLLHAGSAPPWTYTVALVGLSGIFYALNLDRRAAAMGPDWALVHRAGGLGGAAVTVLGTLAATASLASPDDRFLGAMVATVGLALLLLADARLKAQPLLEYAAALVAVLLVYWVDRDAGVTNPQLYLPPVGIALVVAAVAASHDRRVRVDPGLLHWVSAAGLVLVMGTTALQSLSEQVPWTYTGFLVAEAAGSVLVGVGMRNRVLVVGGGAAVALASLRALLLIEQQYPLYVVFGGVALLLLVVAGVLSIMRDRLAAARGSLGRSWKDWS